jgi:hypothetical protein
MVSYISLTEGCSVPEFVTFFRVISELRYWDSLLDMFAELVEREGCAGEA